MFEFSKHDYRLLAPAVTVWVTCIAVSTFADMRMMSIGVFGAFLVCASLILATWCMRSRGACQSRMQIIHTLLPQITRYLVISASAALCALVSCVLHAHVRDADMSSTLEPQRVVQSVVRITSPVMSSSMRNVACSARAHAREFTHRHVTQHSFATVRVLISENVQCQLERGATYRIHAHVKKSRFDSRMWELHVPRTCGEKIREPCITKIDNPSWGESFVSFVHAQFLLNTARLSTVGSILVPGVTLGIMGNDAYVSSAGELATMQDSQWQNLQWQGAHEQDIQRQDESMQDMPSRDKPPESASHGSGHTHRRDDCNAVCRAEAKKLKEAFRTAGIMHVLAVSGGHFALVVSAVTWALKRMRVHRMLRSWSALVMNCMVYAVMYPSDSTLRAFVMGFISAGYVALGRRADALAALSWTVIGVLLYEPNYAESIGFALSCVSVAGIIICVKPLTRAWESIMPRKLSAVCAVTTSAQIVTLPLTVLVYPSIPVYAVVSNVLIAVPMDIATICGLAGLCLSWICPSLGYACVWIAAMATTIMAKVCYGIAVLPYATLQCNFAQLLILYAVLSCAIFCGIRCIRKWRQSHMWKSQYHPSVQTRMRNWSDETGRLIPHK